MAILIGVQTQPPGSDSPILAEATSQPPILETIPFSGAAEPVSLSREVEKPNAVSDEQLREQRLRINALLQDFELQLRLNADAVEPKTELQE
nr:anti sigma-E factor RseA C-terminal domain-containing protein [Veronia nyctiphanis]